MMNKYPWAIHEIEEHFPIASAVLYSGATNSQFKGATGVVTGYPQSGGIEVRFGPQRAVILPENLTVLPEDAPKVERCLACFEKDDRYGHTCSKDNRGSGSIEVKAPEAKSDVSHPNQYKLLDNVEAVEIIARSMTTEAFRGFCLGNVLKYHLRAGKKSELATIEKDLKKATFYQELFDKYKGMCHDAT